MNKGKRQEIELGYIYCCYFLVVVILHWEGLSEAMKFLVPSSRNITSILYLFVNSALFQTTFIDKPEFLQNQTYQITSTA